MLNSKKKTKTEDLFHTLAQARKALTEWSDHKTEALIQLDSIAYDLRIIEEEKAKAVESSELIRHKLEDQERVFQGQVNALTDEMQMLKLEKEALQNELDRAHVQIQTAQSETKEIKDRFIRIQAEQAAQIAELQAEAKARLDQETEKLMGRIVEMTHQLANAQSEKREIQKSTHALERELGGIRNQMLSALKATQELKIPERALGAPVQKRPSDGMNEAEKNPETNDLETVEDYLKRFGY